MIISHTHKFIFIHVYKAAGSSVARALKPYAHAPVRFVPHLMNQWEKRLGTPPRHLHSLRIFPSHIDTRHLIDQLPFGMFEDYFTFAFVRNPWDWQVSMYHYGLATPENNHHQLFKELGSFEAYVDWRMGYGQRTQKSFITDEDGKIMVDFVGRFERIDEDFTEICNRIGIDAQLPRVNVSGRKRDFREYFTPRTRDLIGNLFAEDVEAFGYTFD